MFSRVIAVAIMLVLFWSGFTAQQQVTPLGSLHTEQAEAVQPPHGHDGSADDRSLDEQPAQAQGEGAMDMPALVMARLEVTVPTLTMAGPRPHAASNWLSADLDGPQRPPRAEPRSA